MNEENLGEALREEKLPRVCDRHPRAVWHDELVCPACIAEAEFLLLTNHLKSPLTGYNK